MPLAGVLELFADSLKFAQTFTGKGGGRRNGCMVNCDADEAAASAAEAYLAGRQQVAQHKRISQVGSS
jgi:hypothetical protein